MGGCFALYVINRAGSGFAIEGLTAAAVIALAAAAGIAILMMRRQRRPPW